MLRRWTWGREVSGSSPDLVELDEGLDEGLDKGLNCVSSRLQVVEGLSRYNAPTDRLSVASTLGLDQRQVLY